MKKGLIKATDAFERIVHWSLAISCIVLFITGLGMMFHSFNFVGTMMGGLKSLKYVHNFAGLFFIVALFGLCHHEMWRDEIETWMVARDSPDLATLFEHQRYTGHPSLWYLLLFALTRLTQDPKAMALLHLAIATLTVYLFLRYSPFTPLQKGLFGFGYFPFYEYALISRAYALGLFFA